MFQNKMYTDKIIENQKNQTKKKKEKNKNGCNKRQHQIKSNKNEMVTQQRIHIHKINHNCT